MTAVDPQNIRQIAQIRPTKRFRRRIAPVDFEHLTDPFEAHRAVAGPITVPLEFGALY
ncbi:hypothetical protein H7K38_25385 [Mycobacterium alsense]|nr:hypothetical protein [Mycobacterium alsense]MCV7381950.1 hypothetical protein [Mycobacterium alsense]